MALSISGRKRIRYVLSLLGAFVALTTFVAKDDRREKYKDLTSAIDSAENAYIVRTETRQIDQDLADFKTEFEEFRQHPTVPYTQSGGGGFDTWDVDMSTVVQNARSQVNSTGRLIDNIVRLFNKLPENAALQKKMDSITQSEKEFWDYEASVDSQVITFDKVKYLKHTEKETKATEETYQGVLKLKELATVLTDEAEKMSGTILTGAEAERRKSEESFHKWDTYTLLLYFIAFLLGIAAVVLGDGEASPKLEG